MTRSLFITLLAVMVLPGCDQAPPPASQQHDLHPELAEHTRHFDKKVYQIGERV